MNLFSKRNKLPKRNDTTLVLASLGGDRNAFCEIVSRYQNLLCSIAYSAVGDLKHSEDIAQEAFIDAWKKLDTLSDPQKLKSWLCGILRFKVSRYRRKEQNQATTHADDIDDTATELTNHKVMDEEIIDQQEQLLMWKALDQMDEIYREPLILFYREQNSVEHVAEELELNVATVKQRLSRGRKLLHKSMIKYVEDTLVKSKPGLGFTAAVLLVINGIAPPAKAAAFGLTAAKTGSMVKLTTLVTFIASLAGVISSYFGIRATLDQSRTTREKQQVANIAVYYFSSVIFFIASMYLLRFAAIESAQLSLLFTTISQVLVFGFVITYLLLESNMYRAMQRLRSQERIFYPEAFQNDQDKNAKNREYKSKLTLLNVPLLHFQFGRPEMGDKPAFGWISGGNRAYGLLFAWGGVAIAPISVGIISFGLISIGAVGFGLLTVGVVAIGLIGFGTTSVAFKAYAAVSALGWESALSGGFSVAKEAALGNIAYAKYTNSEQAIQIADLTLFEQNYLWVLIVMAVAILVPAIWHSTSVRSRMKTKTNR